MTDRLMSFTLAACAGVALSLTGCGDSEKDERGMKYMPEMYDSPALKAQEAFTVTGEEGAVEVNGMLTPPAGTVARDIVTYDIPEDDWDAAKANPNPYQATEDIMLLGRQRYETFCVVCHGRDGNAANGPVNGKVMGILSVNTESVENMPDGQIYHIISYGRGRMPNYRAQMDDKERWAVVHYMRALYRATVAGDDELQRLEELEREAGRRLSLPPEPIPEYQTWPDKKGEDAP